MIIVGKDRRGRGESVLMDLGRASFNCFVPFPSPGWPLKIRGTRVSCNIWGSEEEKDVEGERSPMLYIYNNLRKDIHLDKTTLHKS